MTTNRSERLPNPIRSLINGEWRDGPNVEQLHNPFDGSVVAELVHTSESDLEAAITGAQAAFDSWKRRPAFERAGIISDIAELTAKRANAFVDAMCLHTGKPVREGRAEVERTISTLRVSAEEAKRVGGEIVPMEQVPAGRGKLGFAIYQPLGVVAGISPFNAPLNLVAHKLGPALAAGDTLVLKPHPQGSSVAVLLGDIALEAGLPTGVFNIVHGGADVGRSLVRHPAVALVNFTGSGRVAEEIIREAGLKRTLLELGGNAPTIVHEDARWERASELLVKAAFGLSGQSCVSTQRIYAHESIAADLANDLAKRAAKLHVGDPQDERTDVGPLSSLAAAERVGLWLEEAVAAGATALSGNRRNGALVWPTVLTNAQPSMKVVCEEVFGPVVTVLPYHDIDQAIAAANDSPWGLKVGVFTESMSVAIHAARELNFGTVNLNAPSRSRTDNEPSGGTKASGWGKEGPRYAIRELSTFKMVSVNPS